MALRLLGEPPIDIHAGGIDLIFPHHENEIAQSEGATGKPFSRFWVHVEHLLVDEREDVEVARQRLHACPTSSTQGYRPSALRYLLLSSHYRKQLNFTWTGLEQAEEALRRLDRLPGAARRRDGRRRACRDRRARGDAARRGVRRGAARAISTPPAALGAMFELVRALNAAIDAQRDRRRATRRSSATRSTQFDRVLGVLSPAPRRGRSSRRCRSRRSSG